MRTTDTEHIKTITELRNSLFETFDAVVAGETHQITHKNGNRVIMMSTDEIEKLRNEANLHKNLAIGYAQALRGNGISTTELNKRLKEKEQALRDKYA